MHIETKPVAGLSHDPCCYGLSKIHFRGPHRATEGRYIVCLGGSETFGRTLEKPFPALVEAALGETCVNLGHPKAGLDMYLQDSAVRALIHDAQAVVVQIMGAANLSNRYYRVHPRRNDRFIAPTQALRDLYPEIDFAEISFTGHLISKLIKADLMRFAQVREVLQATWVRRMKALIGAANGPVQLLWLGGRHPDEPAVDGAEPEFVTQEMVAEIMPYVLDLAVIHPDEAGQTGAHFEAPKCISSFGALPLAAHEQAACEISGLLQLAIQ